MRGPGALDEALARLDVVEDHVHAWVRISPREGRASGPLAGVLVGIKDIVDVAGVPTLCGSPVRADAGPASADAEIVRRLLDAGATVVGKTVTTEFAFYDAGPTRNPHDTLRTPGGSSSGSAAAVAAGVVPLAVGTQTAGSVVRPASFCGVAGYALPRGRVPYDGIAALAPGLDTVGLFAATVADVALARVALDGRGPVGPATRPPRLLAWDGTDLADVEPSMRAAHADAVARCRAAGADVEDLAAALGGESARRLAADHRTIMAAEAAASVPASDRLGPHLTAFVAEGRAVDPAALTAARTRADAARTVMLELLDEVDALLAPGALGVAPRGLASTGDPAMSRPWHLLGLPALAVPGRRDPAGLPLGLQLLGHPDREDALLATGAWLAERLGS